MAACTAALVIGWGRGMNTAQALAVALIQGLSEFLPISSTAHLQLPHILLSWPSPGLLLDTALHLGTLAAVLLYFRRDLWGMVLAAGNALRHRRLCADSRLLLQLACATVPVMLVGFVAQASPAYRAWRQEPWSIALATVLFALLLWRADAQSRSRGAAQRLAADMTWRDAWIIGLFEIFALVPGASRAGVTLSAAFLLGLERRFAARFAFLLAIPVILAAVALELPMAYADRHSGGLAWGSVVMAALLAGGIAYATIAWFLHLVERVGLLPFVFYRLALGALLFWVAWSNGLP